jgi:hypothetical protein
MGAIIIAAVIVSALHLEKRKRVAPEKAGGNPQ